MTGEPWVKHIPGAKETDAPMLSRKSLPSKETGQAGAIRLVSLGRNGSGDTLKYTAKWWG